MTGDDYRIPKLHGSLSGGRRAEDRTKKSRALTAIQDDEWYTHIGTHLRSCLSHIGLDDLIPRLVTGCRRQFLRETTGFQYPFHSLSPTKVLFVVVPMGTHSGIEFPHPIVIKLLVYGGSDTQCKEAFSLERFVLL
jgi:hypothetical protein